jgi:hypothetical protein
VGYISAVKTVEYLSLSDNGAADKVVIYGLNYFFSGYNSFEDGSVYHALYATTYYAELLSSAHDCWLGQKLVVDIYNQFLKGRESLVTEQREQIFELEKGRIGLERDKAELTAEVKGLKNQNRQRRRMVLLAFIGVALFSIALLWIGPAWDIGGLTSGPVENKEDAFLALLSAATGLTAIIVTGIEIIFFRSSGK